MSHDLLVQVAYYLLFHIPFEFEVVWRDSELWEGERFLLFWLPTCFLELWVVFINFSGDESRERFVRLFKRPELQIASCLKKYSRMVAPKTLRCAETWKPES